jgi:signal transduction histidine kinase
MTVSAANADGSMDLRRGYLRAIIALLGRWAGPRPWVMLAAVAFMAALFGAMGYEFLQSQTDSRRQAETSFGVQARITSELTSSLFASSASSAAAAAAKAFGGPSPSSAALTEVAKRSHLAYALILDSSGRKIAASAGAPPAAAAPAANLQRAHVRGSWLSDLIRPSTHGPMVIEWVLAFPTPSGQRFQVEAFNATALVGFLRGYLHESGANPGQVGYLVDGHGRAIADSTGTARLGSQLAGGLVEPGGGSYRGGGAERYVAAAGLQGSAWRVLLSEPTAVLYPALAGSKSWILTAALVAFGIIALVALILLRRMLVGTARVVDANRQLEELNATLEHRVAERTAVAEQRAEELARSNSELEQFASVASHDLQEPLRKIRMYGQRLLKQAGGELPQGVVSDVTRMHDAAERMQRLIDDLLSFARVTSRHREFERVDLTVLARQVVGDLEARVHELDAEVEIGELAVVEADPAQMGQLLQNLVSNALKFHRDGVRPIVRIGADLLEGGLARFAAESVNGRCCVITVEDNGIGFEPRYADRIFSAFERLHSRSEYDGTGIGLSIARKIAWRHGGELTATSTPGCGSTFTLTLPIARPTETADRAA